MTMIQPPEVRDIDGNGHVPEPPRRCDCCQKVRTGPEALAVFGRLEMDYGGGWDICGKCIQRLWRKRQPKLEPLDVLCA